MVETFECDVVRLITYARFSRVRARFFTVVLLLLGVCVCVKQDFSQTNRQNKEY